MDVELDVRGLVLLHNADRNVIDKLGRAVERKQEAEVPLLGREDVEDLAGLRHLSERLAWPRLVAPGVDQLEAFANARHRPSFDLFGNLKDVLAKDSNFVLVGAQQEAQLHVLGAIRAALAREKKHVIAVTGGPGTGKTVIATRLLADIPTDGGVRARYLTPSGTLRQQLIRAAKDPAAKGLFLNVRDYPSRRPSREVLLVDEAQRLSNGGSRDAVADFVACTRVCVFFLDERQIIRPNEGTSVHHIAEVADVAKAAFTHVDLQAQFRCAGSQYYQRWIDELLSVEGQPVSWRSDDYDFGVVADPAELQAWVDDHTASGVTARISAGFCWPWPDVGPNRPLRTDVEITYVDRRSGLSVRWAYPWNSKHARADHGGPIAPIKEYWATEPSGHRQVGASIRHKGSSTTSAR